MACFNDFSRCWAKVCGINSRGLKREQREWMMLYPDEVPDKILRGFRESLLGEEGEASNLETPKLRWRRAGCGSHYSESCGRELDNVIANLVEVLPLKLGMLRFDGE